MNHCGGGRWLAAIRASDVRRPDTPTSESPTVPTSACRRPGSSSVAAWMRPAHFLPRIPGTASALAGQGRRRAAGMGLFTCQQEPRRRPAAPQTGISFYVFDPRRRRGDRRPFQDSVQAANAVPMSSASPTGRPRQYYKTASSARCDRYTGTDRTSTYCQGPLRSRRRARAPVGVGRASLESFFAGAIREVRVWIAL